MEKEVDDNIVKYCKGWIKKENLSLQKWHPPKDNLNWSHDHCPFCQKEISNSKNAEKEAYTDKENTWVCKSCFEKYLIKN